MSSVLSKGMIGSAGDEQVRNGTPQQWESFQTEERTTDTVPPPREEKKEIIRHHPQVSLIWFLSALIFTGSYQAHLSGVKETNISSTRNYRGLHRYRVLI